MANQYVTDRLKRIAEDEAARIAAVCQPSRVAPGRGSRSTREPTKRVVRRWRETLKRHGLNDDGYMALLTAQDCRCGQCRRPIVSCAPGAFHDRPGPRRGSGRLSLETDGMVRLLCGYCHSLTKMLDKSRGV